jgi:tRNA(Ile)-lysidine synthase
MTLLEQVRRTIERHRLADPRTRVVVAVSGGPDSTALAHLLGTLAARVAFTIVGACHFNHQLRPAAERDEQFCAELAKSLGWRILIEREDVGARAREARTSIEEAARTARHAFFERAVRHFEADVVALGHTRDDQAETFLLRLLRGAGARGLGAMHPRRGVIVRPLLDCRRLVLKAYLDKHGLPYVHDESNDDVGIPRNRIRHELLPILEQRFNPSIVDALATEAEIARDDWRWMTDVAAEAAEGAIRREPGVWHLDVEVLRALPRALARMVVRQAMLEAADGRAIGARWVEAALRLSEATRGHLDGPGVSLDRRGNVLELAKKAAGERYSRAFHQGANLFSVPLAIPGEVSWPEAGWSVSAEMAPSAAAGAERAAACNGGTVLVQLHDSGPLTVRSRRPGDWLRPAGLGGRKKLQDYFVDRKLPRAVRDFVPLVVDRFDRIIWVAGYTIDDQFGVTDPAQPVLLLGLKVVGGSA